MPSACVQLGILAVGLITCRHHATCVSMTPFSSVEACAESMCYGCRAYAPQTRAVPIPKKSGGVRLLGIPTVADRIAQTAVKMWLELRLEQVFRDDSYGYRPGKSALAAIAVTRRRCWDYDWVVEFDIRGLFDNLDHGLLMKALRKHCQEPWILLYVER